MNVPGPTTEALHAAHDRVHGFGATSQTFMVSADRESWDRRDQALKRLNRAAGQVAGISRMIDDGRHCTEVLQQIAAVQKALEGVGNIVMRNYLEQCVTTAIEGGDPLIYDELMTVLTRYR